LASLPSPSSSSSSSSSCSSDAAHATVEEREFGTVARQPPGSAGGARRIQERVV
jgi:hypothetical protein